MVDEFYASSPVLIPSSKLRRAMSSVDISPDSHDSYKEFLCKCYKENMENEKSICESEMLKNLTKCHALKMFQMANSYDCPKLLEDSLKLIFDNFQSLFHSDDFTDLCKHDLRILLQDCRIEETDSNIGQILDRWYLHEQDARYADYVKLSDMFIDPTANDDLFCSDIECQLLNTVQNDSIRPPIFDMFEKQSHKTHIVILCKNGDTLNFLVVEACDPSQIVGWVDPPPLEEYPYSYQHCVANFCRTDYVFLKTDNVIWKYNVYKSQWKSVQELKPTLVGSGFVGNENSVYVVGGGYTRSGELSTAVYKYNMKNKKWKEHGKLEKPVYQPACITYKGTIYIFGGAGHSEINPGFVQTYLPGDRQSNVRQILQVDVSGGQCVIANKCIFIATPDKKLVEFDPESRKVLKVSTIDILGDHFEIVSDTKFIYVVEGNTENSGARVLAYYPRT